VNYELPFGIRRKFLAHSKLLNIAVGGWAVNFQTTLQSGFPLAISQTNLNSVIGASVQRPNATRVSPVTSGDIESRIDNYVNKRPGIANTDFSIFKSYTLEHFEARFRADIFNLTNTPQFYGLVTNLNASSLGQVTPQANFSRIVQLGFASKY
jgi:hypothetical protein